MTESSALNNEKRTSLLRGAGTRIANWFYAMHGLVRQKQALYATVHNTAFQKLDHNARIALAVQDIEDSLFMTILLLDEGCVSCASSNEIL